MAAMLEKYGEVDALCMGRRIAGVFPPLMYVRCYAVDGLLIDSGLNACADQVRAFVGDRGIRHAVITHHHEDHSGNVGNLVASGCEVSSSARAQPWIERGFVLHFYQRLGWGRPALGETRPVGSVVETSRYTFKVIPAPGHCDDQVVLFEAKQGWLFSGDAFLAERVKVFRADEDFDKTMSTLAHLCDLEFDALYCAHRPVATGGRQALRNKFSHLTEIAGRVRDLYAQGLTLHEITHRVMGPDGGFGYWLTWGDTSKFNLVRSILQGPVPRPERHP